MQLIFIRHAEPVRVEANGGVADPELHERGYRQAAAVAEYLRSESIEAIYQSPSRRAIETVAPLAQAAGLEPVTLDGLAEFDHGSPDYLPIEELKALNDHRWQAILRGEPYGDDLDPEAFRQRIADTVGEIIDKHPGGRVAIGTHTGVINAFTSYVAGVQKILWIAPGFASITRVTAGRDGRRSLTSVNETGHLRSL